MKVLRIFLTAACAWLPLAALADTYLLMAEENGCVWCARWDAEIAPIYPKTAEGTAAPLRRFDIRGPEPGNVAFASRVRFTPTFVLVRDGEELGRIEGYPGDNLFWSMLSVLMQKADVPVDPAG